MKKVIFAGIILLSIACLALTVYGVLYFYPVFRTSQAPRSPLESVEKAPTKSEMQVPVTPTMEALPATPETLAESTVPAPAAGSDFSFEGVHFVLDPAVAARATGQIIPEKKQTQDGPYWDINPRYAKVSFSGYPIDQTVLKPVISVYPVEEYRKLDPHVSQTLDDLKHFLTTKQEEAEQFPFLPVLNAGQVFHSNVKYLNFRNGEGVRYLAIYAQYPAPVNNQDLFYTYQGLTADGRYFVSIILPVSNPVLRADLNAFSSGEMEAIMKNYDTYRMDAAALLDAQPVDSFTPSITQLDALVKSLAIER
jgi:hypothetical protein